MDHLREVVEYINVHKRRLKWKLVVLLIAFNFIAAVIYLKFPSSFSSSHQLTVSKIDKEDKVHFTETKLPFHSSKQTASSTVDSLETSKRTISPEMATALPKSILTASEISEAKGKVSTHPVTVTSSQETVATADAITSETIRTITETIKNTEIVRITETTATSPTTTPSDIVTTNDTVHVRGWDSGSFCDELLHKTFTQLVPVCATDHNEQSAIICKRTPKSTVMIECSMMNVLIRPKKLYSGMVSHHIVNSEGIELLSNDLFSCKSPNLDGVHRTTERNDHTRLLVEESVRHGLSSSKPSDCQRWINETTFLFRGENIHVYFEFLTWYNVHKSILDQGKMDSYKVLRIAAYDFTYLFGDYEKLLFPGIEFVQDMKEESVCFRKLILPPWGFANLLFRCKMDSVISSRCFQCNGKGRSGTAIRSFRTQALKACLLNDHIPVAGYQDPKIIVVILRKQYIRHPDDKPEKFQRVLSNSDQLLSEIKARFKVNVTSFYGEDLPMCEQIRIVHSADIFIGVHGAGLVHALWLQDNALLFEIEPSDQTRNPAFRMLTTLAGINYKSFRLHQVGSSQISVDVQNVVNTLESTVHNGV